MRDASAGLENAIQSWLDAGRLPPPPGLEVRATVVADASLLPGRGGAAIYSTPDLHCSAGEAGGIEVHWLGYPACGRVHPTLPRLEVLATAEAVESGIDFFRRFLINAMILTMKRSGLYHLHAATARDPAGEDWVLTGDSCCGKSTTAALLARRGWAVGTDDISFLHREGSACLVSAWRSLIALREGGRALLSPVGGTPLPERGKQGFLPEELGGIWIQTVRPRYLLFPELGATRTRLEPLAPGEVLQRIIPWSFWVLFEAWGAEEYLATLQTLAAQATAYRLHLAPDLMARPGALRELLP